MVVSSGAEDIVYSNLFTGVHGNYLRGSISQAGLNPDDLPQSDPTKMTFATGADGKTAPKAWKEIWGSGQGIGAITESRPVAELAAELSGQFAAARAELETKLNRW